MTIEQLAEIGARLHQLRGAQHATPAWIEALLALAADPLAKIDDSIRGAIEHAGWIRVGGLGIAEPGAEILRRHLGVSCEWNGYWRIAEEGGPCRSA